MFHMEPDALPFSKIVGKRLLAIRRSRDKLSQERLADLLSERASITISRSQIAKIETGHAPGMDVDLLAALVAVLDIPPLAILIPDDLGDAVAITPRETVSAGAARRWWHGWQALPTTVETNAVHYFLEVFRDARSTERRQSALMAGISRILEEADALGSHRTSDQAREDAAEVVERLLVGVHRLIRTAEKQLKEIGETSDGIH